MVTWWTYFFTLMTRAGEFDIRPMIVIIFPASGTQACARQPQDQRHVGEAWYNNQSDPYIQFHCVVSLSVSLSYPPLRRVGGQGLRNSHLPDFVWLRGLGEEVFRALDCGGVNTVSFVFFVVKDVASQLKLFWPLWRARGECSSYFRVKVSTYSRVSTLWAEIWVWYCIVSRIRNVSYPWPTAETWNTYSFLGMYIHSEHFLYFGPNALGYIQDYTNPQSPPQGLYLSNGRHYLSNKRQNCRRRSTPTPRPGEWS